MRDKQTAAAPALVTAALLGFGMAAWAQQSLDAPPPATQRLDGVVVTAKPNPIARSKRRLDDLKKSLPALGSDTPRKPDATDRVAAYLAAHREPNRSTGEQRRMME